MSRLISLNDVTDCELCTSVALPFLWQPASVAADVISACIKLLVAAGKGRCALPVLTGRLSGPSKRTVKTGALLNSGSSCVSCYGRCNTGLTSVSSVPRQCLTLSGNWHLGDIEIPGDLHVMLFKVYILVGIYDVGLYSVLDACIIICSRCTHQRRI
jgi:hypothetical protein